MIFPTQVFRSPGPYRKPGGNTYEVAGASNQEQLDNLLSRGWHLNVKDAFDPPKDEPAFIPESEPEPVIPSDDAPPTREELIEKAKELGVPFNARTKDDVLLERITETLGG